MCWSATSSCARAGNDLGDVEALHDALGAAGETLAIDLVRGADELSVTVVFDDAAAAPSA